MIERINITGISYDVDESTDKYIRHRIGKVDKFLPRASRKSATINVTVRRAYKSHGDKYEVEATVKLPGGTILTAKDASSNVLAAVDIVDAKLVTQAKKHKVESLPHVGRRFGILSRLKRTKR